MKSPRVPKIKATTPDKVNGKFVKYRKGDCLTVFHNGKYLALLISEKFNKYYDFTLLEFYKDVPPTIDDFINGRFFGTRMGSWEDLSYQVYALMIECEFADTNDSINLIGKVAVILNLSNSYRYVRDIKEIVDFYLEELPIRIEKTINAEKFPAIAFASKHLVEMKHIIQLPSEISN